MTTPKDTTRHTQIDQDGNEVVVSFDQDGNATFTRDGKKVGRNSIDYWRLETDRQRIATEREKADMQAAMDRMRAEVERTQKRVQRTRKPLNVSIYADTRQRAKAFADANDTTIWEVVDQALNEYLDRNERGEQQTID